MTTVTPFQHARLKWTHERAGHRLTTVSGPTFLAVWCSCGEEWRV